MVLPVLLFEGFGLKKEMDDRERYGHEEAQRVPDVEAIQAMWPMRGARPSPWTPAGNMKRNVVWFRHLAVRGIFDSVWMNREIGSSKLYISILKVNTPIRRAV